MRLTTDQIMTMCQRGFGNNLEIKSIQELSSVRFRASVYDAMHAGAAFVWAAEHQEETVVRAKERCVKSWKYCPRSSEKRIAANPRSASPISSQSVLNISRKTYS